MKLRPIIKELNFLYGPFAHLTAITLALDNYCQTVPQRKFVLNVFIG
ncbi:hypothetical protein HGG75_10890 [Ochrobactrum pseudogrignonense]|nr:hypothetical protein [Brucella pseudogrignonensis]